MVKFKYEEKDLLSDGEDLDVLYKRWKIFFNINEAGNEKEEEQRKRTFQQNVRQVYFRNNKLKLPCPYPKLSLGKFSHLPGNSALGGLLEILYYTSPTSAVLEDGRTVDFVEFRADEFVPFDCKGPRAPCPFDLRDAGLPLEIGAVDLKNSGAPLVHLPQVEGDWLGAPIFDQGDGGMCVSCIIGTTSHACLNTDFKEAGYAR